MERLISEKVFVVGGSGFLGEFLVKYLVSLGHSVTIGDINEPTFEGEFSYRKFDLTDGESFKTVEFDSYDYIINLGGFASLDLSIEYPVQVMEVNVIGNLRLLENLKGVNIKRYVYASSAYALSSKGSFYGISKLTSEKLVEEYGVKWELPYSIIRYGSVYSELEYENNYLYQVIKSAVLNGQINHSGDGEEVREYIHAADAASLTWEVMKSDEYLNSHVILTGVERMRRNEVFRMINEVLGGSVSIKLNNNSYSDHYKYTPYSFNASFNKKLVANPFIDIGQGILACVESIAGKNEHNY